MGVKNTTSIGDDINAEGAWNITKGNAASIIAIIDGGIQVTHPDLAAKVTGGDITDYLESDPTDGVFSHGSHVAGIAAAVTNNNLGVAGVDWNAKLHPKDIFTVQGDQIINQKITDAVNYSTNVWTLNNSWETSKGDDLASHIIPGRYSALVRAAFAYAYMHNRVSCAAMGNDQPNYPGATAYPAAFNTGLLAVGATDIDNKLYVESNVGTNMSVCAPGVHIYSCNSGSNYLYLDGTSMATAFVSGIASLVKGYNPSLDNDDVEWIIKLSATSLGTGTPNYKFGYGLANAQKALQFLQAPYALQQLTVTGGSTYSTSSGLLMRMIGVQGLADAYYYVNRVDVRTTVNLPSNYCSITGVWGRGVKTTGLRDENNFCYGEGICDVVAQTSTTATLRTYVYEMYDITGRLIGYYPRAPQYVTFAYTVLGVPQPAISGPSSFCSTTSGAYTLSNLQSGTSVVWSVTPSGFATPNTPNSTSTTLNRTGNGVVTVEATVTNGCGAGNNVTVTKPSVLVGGPIVNVTGSISGGCSGSYQTWLLSASPVAYGSNWHWTAGSLPNGSSITFVSPYSSSTYADVSGGGGVELSYTDLCGLPETNGTTVYSTCGNGNNAEVSPNPARGSIIVSLKGKQTISIPAGPAISASEMQVAGTTATGGKTNNSSNNIAATVKVLPTAMINEVRIFDVNGKLRKVKTLSTPAAQVQIDVNDLLPGNYFVEIHYGQNVSHQNLVIVR